MTDNLDDFFDVENWPCIELTTCSYGPKCPHCHHVNRNECLNADGSAYCRQCGQYFYWRPSASGDMKGFITFRKGGDQ